MNRRDIHGDGHGFVDVSQGGPLSRESAHAADPANNPPGRKRVVEVRTPRYAFTKDLRKMPHDNRPFLGLYEANGQKEVYIIFRADKPEAGFSFLTNEGSQHPHYINDPIAWAEFPDYE